MNLIRSRRKLARPGMTALRPRIDNESVLRLLVAIELTDEWRLSLARYMERMRSAISREQQLKSLRLHWIKPEALHINLKFLGEVPAFELPRLVAIINRVVTRPLDLPLGLTGAGCATERGEPQIVWASISEGESDSSRLSALSEELQAALAGAGIARDRRPFAPHFTLARLPLNASMAQRDMLAELISDIPTPSVSPLVVRRLSLLSSYLGLEDTWYQRLETFPSPSSDWQPV